MRLRFNPPPNWPTVPPDWSPPPGWQPDPGLPALPPGWQLWVEDPEGSSAGGAAGGGAVPGSIPLTGVILPPDDPAHGGADGHADAHAHADSFAPAGHHAGEDGTSPPPAVIHVRLGDLPEPPHSHRWPGLLTGLVVAVLALLVAGIAVSLTKNQDVAPPAVAGPTPLASVPLATATPESLTEWASSIRQPVLDIQAAVEDFVDAAPKRDRAGLEFACSAIQQGVSGAQAAGPAPDLAIATAFNQALSLYAQAASSCIQGAATLDPAQLMASADAIKSATGHLMSVSTKLSRSV